MTLNELFKQAYNDYLSICALVEGEDFEKSYNDIQEIEPDVMNKDDELYDINFGVCCFTIQNIKGRAQVAYTSIEVWDSDTGLVGNFTINEIAEKGGIKD